MTEKIFTYMKQEGMLPQNGNIVVGVSGGPDSVCLLCVLWELQKSLGRQDISQQLQLPEDYRLQLAVVHVDHGLRAEAAADAAFVRGLCADRQIPFYLIEADIEQIAREKKLSCEEAGRQVRYQAFADVLRKMDESTGDSGCIAVAHNQDDRAETFLFHLFRGTGLQGMGSIRPVRAESTGGKVIRPLLQCSRREIEQYLKQRRQDWQIDATNAQDLYTRNKIRNRILPYAEQEICAGSRSHLAKEAELLAETADFVRRQAREALARCCEVVNEREYHIDVFAFAGEDRFLQKEILRLCMERAGHSRDMTEAHAKAVRVLLEPMCTSGRSVLLPVCDLEAVRQFGKVILRPAKETLRRAAEIGSGQAREAVGALEIGSGQVSAAAGAAEHCLQIPLAMGIVEVPGVGTAEISVQEVMGNFENIPEKKYTKWFDYDKIKEHVLFRTRQIGDYLTINEALSRKTLKRYLIEEKIPAEERDAVVVLADGAHIMWVLGRRISAAYKVTEQTKHILKVHFRKGEENGREN